MKPIHIVFACLLPLLFVACDENIYPVVFEYSIDGKEINLAKRTGDSWTLIDEEDTLKIRILYNKSKKENTIILLPEDTLFHGLVTKRKEMYLLQRELNDDYYSIHALVVTDSTVQGLGFEYEQSELINQFINQGRFTDLYEDSTSARILRAEKRDAKKLFRAVLESIPVFKRADYVATSKPALDDDNLRKIISNVYPNPNNGRFTIQTLAPSRYSFSLLNQSGQVVARGEFNDQQSELNNEGLQGGMYVLEVTDHNANQIERVKIVVKK